MACGVIPMVGIGELTKNVSKKVGIPQKTTRKIIKAFLNELVSEVHKGNRVTIVGFGAFEMRKQAPRKARNPRTGEIIRVPAKNKFVFRPSKVIKYK